MKNAPITLHIECERSRYELRSSEEKGSSELLTVEILQHLIRRQTDHSGLGVFQIRHRDVRWQYGRLRNTLWLLWCWKQHDMFVR